MNLLLNFNNQKENYYKYLRLIKNYVYKESSTNSNKQINAQFYASWFVRVYIKICKKRRKFSYGILFINHI